MGKPEGKNVHRVAVLTAAMALLAAPAPGVAAPAGRYDLAPAVMQRLFGETTDRGATLAAAYGDRTSESPLRDFAFGSGRFTGRGTTGLGSDFVAADTPVAAQSSAGPFNAARSQRSALAQQVAHFTFDSPAFAAAAPTPGVAPPVSDYTVGRYEPVPEPTTIVAQPGSIAFGPTLSASAEPASSLAFGDANAPAGASSQSFVTPSSIRLGTVQIGTRTQGASVTVPSSGLQDSMYGAGANFDVRAGQRSVNVDLSSNYERLTRNESLPAPALSATSWRLPDDGEPLVIPNYADVSKVSLGAALALPVVRGLTLKLDYGADRMVGGYGLPGLTNLDATGNAYGGKLTFQIPKTFSTLSFSASSLRYQDNIAPVNTFTQTRADVNFTVKF